MLPALHRTPRSARTAQGIGLFTLLFALQMASTNAASPSSLPVWPTTAPGEKGNIGEERDMTKPNENLVAGKRVMRLGNVSQPTLTLYRPKKSKDTGTTVLVCPGGGYHILALDLEGTEVCEWLNSIGVTGALLKYRVPRREGLEKHTAPLQDAQRAMGLLRQRAPELGIDPKRIGVLGFSAGGHLAASLSTSGDTRTYPTLDAADALPCRPDFTILVYPGYLTVADQGDRVAPDLNPSANTPPTFLVMSQDDPVRVQNVLGYASALQAVKVPFELHVYPKGGHGYGLRRTSADVTSWPDRVTDWMRGNQWLQKSSARR